MVSRPTKPKPVVEDNSVQDTNAEKRRVVKDGYEIVGGVERPKTDLKASFDDELNPRSEKELSEFFYGTTPLIDPDANVHTRSVKEALTTGKFPERLSPIIAPAKFDRDRYNANPDAYLSIVEPGRVYQPAQPSPTTARLQPLTGRLVQIEQGETVPLRVRALPGVPVTFTTFDLGQFQNLMTSVTVQADRRGIATARYTATTGVIADVHILSASPVTSGQAKFTVNVLLPKPAGGLGAASEQPSEVFASTATPDR